MITFALGVAIVLCGSTANVDLMNGGFETGDFTGWSALGTPYGQIRRAFGTCLLSFVI